MSDHARPDWDDTRVDHAIGMILRLGVMIAALIVLVGAVLYLWQHGGQLPDYTVFHKSANGILNPQALLSGVLALNGVAIIELGLLVLIATPMSRVVLAAYAFHRQHDTLYVVVSIVVFAIVLFSLFVVR
jgi:uncharacterized membrane protein